MIDEQALVVIIDLERDPLSVRVERAKVVLFVRVVGVAEIVVDLDRFDGARNGLLAERRDAGVMTAMPPTRL